MAGIRFGYAGAEISVSTVTKTLFQLLAAANHRVRVERISIAGKSVDATDAPVLFQLLWQTSAGSGGSAPELNKLDEDATETLQASALENITSEPSDGGVILWSKLISPLSTYDLVFPPMRELYVPGGTRLGVRAVTPADANTFVVSGQFEE